MELYPQVIQRGMNINNLYYNFTTPRLRVLIFKKLVINIVEQGQISILVKQAMSTT